MPGTDQPPHLEEFVLPNELEFFTVKCSTKGCVRGLRVRHAPEDHQGWYCPEHRVDGAGVPRHLPGSPGLATRRPTP